MAELKQVILIRADLKLQKGKAAAQCAHAAVEAALKAEKSTMDAWRRNGQKKVVLKVDSEQELYRYAQSAKDMGIATSIITDAGKTHIAPGTVTCAAIGPDEESRVDSITGNLKML